MRVIKYVGDTNQAKIEDNTTGLTVTGLIALLAKKNVDFSFSTNLLVEMNSGATFTSGDNVLPEGDLKLYSTAKQSKGNSERSDLVDLIKSKGTTEQIKAHFGNWTQVSTDNLKALLRTFKPKAAPAAKVALAKVVTKAPVKAAPVATKAIAKAAPVKATPAPKFQPASSVDEFADIKAAKRAYNANFLKR